MSKVKPDKYITIQGWMLTELNLKGNELLVYAIIYGFSQDDESWFTGSRQYLADWCGCTVRSIQTILNNLVDKKLLIKSEETHNGIKHCSYATDFMGSEKISLGSEKISLNNINNNIDTNKVVSKDTTTKSPETTDFSFGVTKKPKQNLYQKCISIIDEKYSSMTNVRKLLIQYLDLRLEIARNENKPFYSNMWIGILKDLDDVHKQGFALEKIIQQSITKGYKSFYPPNSGSSNTVSPHIHITDGKGNIVPQHKSDGTELARNEDGTLMKF